MVEIKSDNRYKVGLENLKKFAEILESGKDDLSMALELRRICPALKTFKNLYYSAGKMNKEKTAKIQSIRSEFAAYRDLVEKTLKKYEEYESKGIFEKAKAEERFLLPQSNYLDARYIVNAYINDSISYDKPVFLQRYKIQDAEFRSCLARVKTNAPELYKEYLKVADANETKRLVLPIYAINNIIEGITSGKTIEGNNFDVYEFYKLAPFQGKDMDYEIRVLSEKFPGLAKYKKAKQRLNNYKRANRGANVLFYNTYSENLFLFVYCFNLKQAIILKKWMKENDIKNLTPIYKGSTVNFYNENTETDIFNREDAEAIFDIMDKRELPYYQEVYTRLKEAKIKNKLVMKNN